MPLRHGLWCLAAGVVTAFLTWTALEWWAVLVAIILGMLSIGFARRPSVRFQVAALTFNSLAAGILAAFLFRMGIGKPWWSFEDLWGRGSYGTLQQLLTFGTLLLLFVPYVEYVLGVWDGAIRRTPVWSAAGWLAGGVVLGAYFGAALGGLLARSSRFFPMTVSGLLVGALIGLWLGVSVDVYLRADSSERRWRFGRAALFKVALLTAATLAMVAVLLNWRSLVNWPTPIQ